MGFTSFKGPTQAKTEFLRGPSGDPEVLVNNPITVPGHVPSSF